MLGLGGGWFEREHEAFGIDFGTGFGERLDRLDEAAGLIRRLLDGETVTHDGRYYSMQGAVCEPRPVQARLPILIGGSGPTKTLRTTAAIADIWNGYGLPDRIAEASEVLRQRCEEIGRPFDEIERTVTIHGVVRDDPAAAREAWAETARRHGLEGVSGSDGRIAGSRSAAPSTRSPPWSTGTGKSGSARSSSSSGTRSTPRRSSGSASSARPSATNPGLDRRLRQPGPRAQPRAARRSQNARVRHRACRPAWSGARRS